MRRVGHRQPSEVAQHDLHELVLEPDARGTERCTLMAAVGATLLVGHRVPYERAVQGQLLGWQVIRAVVHHVDGPVDLGERVQGRSGGSGDKLSSLGGGACLHGFHPDGYSAYCQDTITVNTVTVVGSWGRGRRIQPRRAGRAFGRECPNHQVLPVRRRLDRATARRARRATTPDTSNGWSSSPNSRSEASSSKRSSRS